MSVLTRLKRGPEERDGAPAPEVDEAATAGDGEGAATVVRGPAVQADGDGDAGRPRGVPKDSSQRATIKRTVAEFREDNLSDWAAALTYYGLLSLFPALVALVAVVGLFGDPGSTTRTVTEMVTAVGPKSAAQTFAGPIKSITSNRGAAGLLFFAGLAVALWSASSYVGAFMRASNVIYETREGRPFWQLRPLQVLITLAMVVLTAIATLGLVLTGPLVDAVAKPLNVGAGAVTAWDIAKWPVLAAVFLLMINLLYYASPNVKLRGFRWVTPGSVLALVVWITASAGFAFYAANFGSYDKTYGTLGGLVVLLVWLWITNSAILLGHELNAERERSLQFEEGTPRAERGLQLQARVEPKGPRTG